MSRDQVSVSIHHPEKNKVVYSKFSVQFFRCTSPRNPVYHIKMNNGRFVSVIISFIVIYCVAAFCHTLYVFVCGADSFFFSCARSLVRSRLSFVLFLRIRINRVFGVLSHFAAILHYCVALAMFCRTNEHMREETSKKKKRTHAYVTGEDECLLARSVCVCVPHIARACARLRYEFSMVFLLRFCCVFGQTAWGRTWIEIEDCVCVDRKEVNHWMVRFKMCDSVVARSPRAQTHSMHFIWKNFGFPQNITKDVPYHENTSTRLLRVVNLQMPALIGKNWLSICWHRKKKHQMKTKKR